MKQPEQGILTEVQRGDGTKQELHTYCNSSDFPMYDIILMTATKTALGTECPTERIPMNEEIWQAIGKRLGYRFRKSVKETKQ